MRDALPDALLDAMHVTERTDERTKSLQDPSENVAFLNAHENGAGKTVSWCDEHNRTLNAAGECRGCAADRKAAPRPIDVIDNKTRASGGRP